MLFLAAELSRGTPLHVRSPPEPICPFLMLAGRARVWPGPASPCRGPLSTLGLPSQAWESTEGWERPGEERRWGLGCCSLNFCLQKLRSPGVCWRREEAAGRRSGGDVVSAQPSFAGGLGQPLGLCVLESPVSTLRCQAHANCPAFFV